MHQWIAPLQPAPGELPEYAAINWRAPDENDWPLGYDSRTLDDRITRERHGLGDL
jgi:hypothetical protein